MEMPPIPPMHPTTHPLTCKEERRLRDHDAIEWSADVVIIAVIPELEMIVARAEDQDLEVHLVDKVSGVQWKDLSLGQHLRVKLMGILAPSVISTEIA